MKFGEIAELRRESIQPTRFNEYRNYLGYESIAPNSLHITQWDTPKSVSSAKLAFHPNDTIYGRLRPYFRKVVWTQSNYGICSSDFWVFKPKNGIDPRFLFYVAALPEFTNIASASSTGTRMPRANWEAISEYEITDFTYEQQKAIGEFLGRFDDKIESNQNLTETIMSLIGAQIDCELSDGSGDLFPVSELAKFVNGGAYTKEASGTGRMVIRIADLNSGPSASTIYNDIDVPDDRLAHFGDLLMSWSGSLGVYVWVRGEAIVNQHIFKVICTNFPAWLVHNRLNAVLHRFRSIAADKATTMGHIQRKHLDETFVEVPVTKLEQLSHLCEPLWNRFISAQLESMQLAALRDALLPELMSGRMRVDEAGCLVSEALDEEVRSV